MAVQQQCENCHDLIQTGDEYRVTHERKIIIICGGCEEYWEDNDSDEYRPD